MPATKLSEIKNLAEAIERGLSAQHQALGGAPMLPRSDEDNDDLFIVPNLTVGPASGHRYKRPDGEWDYDLFQDCVIEWELSVPRLSTFTRETFAATYTLLAQEITRLRLAMDPAQWAALNARLPYHHLTKLVPAGSTQGYNAERGEDMATLRFRCWAGILPTAWPTDLTAYTNPTL
jgi:hypothetical protein